MNALSMQNRQTEDQDKFNGPIIDREKLREGTYVAMLTAIGSVFLVAFVKGVYTIF